MGEFDLLRMVLENRDRMGAMDSRLAVQQALRDGAPTQANLDALERRVEVKMRDLVLELRADIRESNETQAKGMLSEVDRMFAAYRSESQKVQLASSQHLLDAINGRRSKIVWWVLGLVGAIIVSVVSTLLVVWVTGRA